MCELLFYYNLLVGVFLFFGLRFVLFFKNSFYCFFCYCSCCIELFYRVFFLCFCRKFRYYGIYKISYILCVLWMLFGDVVINGCFCGVIILNGNIMCLWIMIMNIFKNYIVSVVVVLVIFVCCFF